MPRCVLSLIGCFEALSHLYCLRSRSTFNYILFIFLAHIVVIWLSPTLQRSSRLATLVRSASGCSVHRDLLGEASLSGSKTLEREKSKVSFLFL